MGVIDGYDEKSKEGGGRICARKFLLGYANIEAPLSNQLKKEQFGWNEEALQAFVALKRAMTHVMVLKMPTFFKQLLLRLMLPAMV